MANVFYEINRDIQGKLIISENQNNCYPKHFHRSLELLYIRSGEMQAVINDVEYNFTKDTIAFIPGFYFHEFNTKDSSDIIALVIPYNYTSDIEMLLGNKIFEIYMNDTDYNRRALKQLEIMLEYKDGIIELLAKGFINVIMGMLYNRYSAHEQAKTGAYSLLMSILSYVDSNYQKNISLDVLAGALGYNKQYISQVFHQSVNEHFSNYLNSVRVQHVVVNASQHEKPNIEQLAYDAGFSNISTFYRSFKRVYSATPKEYFNSVRADSASFNFRQYLNGVEII